MQPYLFKFMLGKDNLEMTLYKYHRSPHEIIQYAVCLYYRFNLSYRDRDETVLEYICMFLVASITSFICKQNNIAIGPISCTGMLLLCRFERSS